MKLIQLSGARGGWGGVGEAPTSNVVYDTLDEAGRRAREDHIDTQREDAEMAREGGAQAGQRGRSARKGGQKGKSVGRGHAPGRKGVRGKGRGNGRGRTVTPPVGHLLAAEG